MKLACWNVNGLRACLNKGFLNWLEKQALDVICLQETKAHFDQLPETITQHPKYFLTTSSAKKKGYSGVATLIKRDFFDNHRIQNFAEIGFEEFDHEGRTLISIIDDMVIFNGYYPNGKRDHSRVDFKLRYSESILQKALLYRDQGKKVILCGDFNTAHYPIDLANPKSNAKTTGFLPQERAWLDRLTGHGFIDVFRHFNPQQEGAYTWWSYRNQCRQRNIGWRIDYFFIDEAIIQNVQDVSLQNQVMGSDHCPVTIEI